MNESSGNGHLAQLGTAWNFRCARMSSGFLWLTLLLTDCKYNILGLSTAFGPSNLYFESPAELANVKICKGNGSRISLSRFERSTSPNWGCLRQTLGSWIFSTDFAGCKLPSVTSVCFSGSPQELRAHQFRRKPTSLGTPARHGTP